MSAANRGKYAEKKVRDWLKAKSENSATFDFYRFPDARAGSFNTVPADFEVVSNGKCYLLEVKEVQHSTRLGYQNFSVDQVARMRRRVLAGGFAWVLLCHWSQDNSKRFWRKIPLETFYNRPGGSSSSWDLQGHPVSKVEQLLEEIFDV